MPRDSIHPSAGAVFVRAACLAGFLVPLCAVFVLGADCNGNGVDDSVETAPTRSGFVPFRSVETSPGAFLLALAEIDGAPGLDVVAVLDDRERVFVYPNNGAGKFGEPIVSPWPHGASLLASGDFDGDGDQDIAAAGSFRVVVLLNKGGGRLEEGQEIAVGSGPVALATGDFDGDGFLDLVTGNRIGAPDSRNVSMILGKGDGTFLPPRNFAAGSGAESIAAADFDGDGDLDLAVANKFAIGISILVNDGAGLLSRRIDLGGASDTVHIELAAGDIDGDRDVDLILTQPFADMTVLRNDGTGSFRDSFVVPLGFEAAKPVFADFDRDGSLDMAVAARVCPGSIDPIAPTVAALFNKGNGAFEDARVVNRTWPSYSIDAGDVDGDGDADILAIGFGRFVVFANRAVGTAADCNRNSVPDECEADCNGDGIPDDCDIAAGLSADCNGNGAPDECDPGCIAPGFPDDCAIASGSATDCDSNGIPDACELVDANHNGIHDACEIGDGTSLDCNENGIPDDADLEPSLAFTQLEVGTIGIIVAMASGDFDGDGRVDLVASADVNGDGQADAVASGDSTGGVFIFSGHGAGILDRERRITSTPGDAIAAVDIDGDGDLDLALGENNQYSCTGSFAVLAVLLNDGRGSFRKASSRWAGAQVMVLASADFDSDGKPDIAAFSSPDHLIFLGSRGLFDPPRKVLDGVDISRRAGLAIADFDGDGAPDIALDRGLLFLGKGNGDFERGGDFPRLNVGPYGPGIAAADFDSDGDVDLVTGVVAINQGKGSFSFGEDIPGPVALMAAADLDGDGRTDLATVIDDWRIVTRRNRGDATFELRGSSPTAFDPTDLEVRDFSGDGYPDIAVASSTARRGTGRSLLVHVNRGDGTFSARERYDAGGSSMALADLDGDGDLDVAIAGDSAVNLWSNSDGTFTKGEGRASDDITTSVQAEDMDRDGDVDLLLATQGASILWNDGRGKFPARTDLGGVASASALGADLDGDGLPDVALQVGNPPRVTVFLNKGPAGFQLSTESPAVVNPFLQILQAGDLDSDGDLDLLLGSNESLLGSNESALALENDGKGSFGIQHPIPVGGVPRVATIADLDGDGRLDLVLSVLVSTTGCGLCDSFISVVHGEGGWIFGEPVLHAVSHSPFALTASDLDLDGDLDIVAPLSELNGGDFLEAGYDVLILLNDRKPRLREWGTLTVGDRPLSVAAGDVDGNHYPDLVVLREYRLVVLRNFTAPPVAVDANHDGILDGCEPVTFRRGDWNQDGRINLSDPIRILRHLFQGQAAPPCRDAGDANDDGKLDITDPIRLLTHLFQGVAAPPEPFAACGKDPTADSLGCFRFEGCGKP